VVKVEGVRVGQQAHGGSLPQAGGLREEDHRHGKPLVRAARQPQLD
jgi:hypothetical protein